jgi:SAM-dependent methyltransferase
VPERDKMNVIKSLVPHPLKRRIKAHWERRDKARLFGSLAPMVPPVSEMFDGPTSVDEFKKNGEEFLEIYKHVCGLRPSEAMLDVGCGIGRKTLPLTQYLNEVGRYEGIDIVSAGVQWCSAQITPRFPNFKFQQIDVYNKHYNPQGKNDPAEYRFPFSDQTFDFVMLGSVFTHMLPAEMINYLSEVHRVLRIGGRCLITYFLLNEESLQKIDAGKSSLDFKYTYDKYRTISEDIPELAIAFDETWIIDRYREVGVEVKRLDYGSWCARQSYLSYQDLILGVKEGNMPT